MSTDATIDSVYSGIFGRISIDDAFDVSEEEAKLVNRVSGGQHAM